MKYFLYLICFVSNIHVLSGQTLGIIGTATPQGWSEDIDMQQDATDPLLWTIRLQLTVGECKFRTNDAWDTNWGASEFPVGIAEPNGANIIIDNAAEYVVEFHTGTGAYRFTYAPSEIGLIGTATPFGTAFSTNMLQNQTNPDLFTLTLQLKKGDCRFQFNTLTNISYGANAFPEGVATSTGADIQIPQDGKYIVTFDKSTGAFSFKNKIEVSSVQLTGSAIQNTLPLSLNMLEVSVGLWAATIKVTDGELLFQVNGNPDQKFGAASFPLGVSTLNGVAIQVPAGEYRITFDATNYNYTFTTVDIFTTIGLIGSATVNGWNSDIDLIQNPNDKTDWYGRVLLIGGEVKFRANDAWEYNWGAADFPIGLGLPNDQNIPVLPGDYTVRFNSETGAYRFAPFMALQKIALIGDGTIMANWTDEIGMNQDINDPFHYTLSGVQLKTGDVKFRANADISVQWGANQFPVGVGHQNGTNIPTQAGTYRVDFNYLTGQYTFSAMSNAAQISQLEAFSIAPNPTNQWLNIQLDGQSEANVAVLDLQGRVVLQNETSDTRTIQMDISQLAAGTYLVRLMTESQIKTQKVVKF
jgi:Secretion system C-terminal sorting domain/Outer membrane protein SusF_SusE